MQDFPINFIFAPDASVGEQWTPVGTLSSCLFWGLWATRTPYRVWLIFYQLFKSKSFVGVLLSHHKLQQHSSSFRCEQWDQSNGLQRMCEVVSSKTIHSRSVGRLWLFQEPQPEMRSGSEGIYQQMRSSSSCQLHVLSEKAHNPTDFFCFSFLISKQCFFLI